MPRLSVRNRIQTVDFPNLSAVLPQLDAGEIFHVRGYWGTRLFLDILSASESAGMSVGELEQLLRHRQVASMQSLGTFTRWLKRLVHHRVLAAAAVPLIEKIGCNLSTTQIDCGVIRYQLLEGLRDTARSSGAFIKEDFERVGSGGIPEILGSTRLVPHRDVRWPHVRILGFWMPLTDLDEGEALTLFPDVFTEPVATRNPAKEPFPAGVDTRDFGLGTPYSPQMRAGDILIFHAASVHSSPARQCKPFRGSVDFRVAYPCLDDFAHYKKTFVHARNLTHRWDHGRRISEHKQRRAVESLAAELARPGAGNGISMAERRHVRAEKGLAMSFSESLASAFLQPFCPDAIVQEANRASPWVAQLMLSSLLVRPSSYFWLDQGRRIAESRGFGALAESLRKATRAACVRTRLPIVNGPIEWPGEPRELLPERLLAQLK